MQAASSRISRGLLDKLKHYSHPGHELKLALPSAPFYCHGCQDTWFGTCYVCEACNFHLHRKCALTSSPIFLPVFGKCRFRFHETPNNSRDGVCAICGKDAKGYVYRCDHCANHIHPCCATLPVTLGNVEVKLNLRKKASSECLECQSKSDAKGCCYVYSPGKFSFHVSCVKEMIDKAWKDGNLYSPNDQTIKFSVLQSALINHITDSVQHGRGGAGTGTPASKHEKMIKAALQLVIPVILGSPIIH